MTMFFEQIFYGRGERGYGVLGASPGGHSFASRIESLCGAVGTPGGDYGGEPFLMSVPEGNRVLMLCGRRGVLDSMGRPTLFFHGLVVEKSAMVHARADAFSLFSQGVFADKMPSGNIVPLRVDVKPSEPVGLRRDEAARATLPCVIRSAKPLDDLVRGIVGGRALALSWATFAFQPMRGFDVQVLSPRVSCPQGVNEYDATGTLLCSAVVASSPQEDGVSRNDCGKRPRPSCGPVANATNTAPKKKANALFGLLVLANIALVVVWFALLAVRGPTPPNNESASPAPSVVVTNTVTNTIEKIVEKRVLVPRLDTHVVTNTVTNTIEKVVEKRVLVPLSDKQKAEIEDVAVRRFCKELKDKAPAEWWRDFGKAVRDADLSKYYGEKDSKGRYPEQYQFFAQLKKFLLRINEKTQEKETP